MPISLELPSWVVREQARTVLRWMIEAAEAYNDCAASKRRLAEAVR